VRFQEAGGPMGREKSSDGNVVIIVPSGREGREIAKIRRLQVPVEGARCMVIICRTPVVRYRVVLLRNCWKGMQNGKILMRARRLRYRIFAVGGRQKRLAEYGMLECWHKETAIINKLDLQGLRDHLISHHIPRQHALILLYIQF
jgi:hypothetical protein